MHTQRMRAQVFVTCCPILPPDIKQNTRPENSCEDDGGDDTNFFDYRFVYSSPVEYCTSHVARRTLPFHMLHVACLRGLIWI